MDPCLPHTGMRAPNRAGHRRRPARRALLWTGLALVTAGLVLLGYFGWEFWGTNLIAHHKQQEQVRELKRQWDRPSLSSAEDGDLDLGAASALIRIPAFGKDYEMPVLEGTSDGVLAQGFGHFAGTAAPGQGGNYALAAHRITHGEPLRHLPDLRPGDEVVVETRRAVYTYVLDTDPNDLVVPFTATWVVDAVPKDPAGDPADPGHGRRLITLTTCSELFHTDNRMIAFGHLDSVAAK